MNSCLICAPPQNILLYIHANITKSGKIWSFKHFYNPNHFRQERTRPLVNQGKAHMSFNSPRPEVGTIGRQRFWKHGGCGQNWKAFLEIKAATADSDSTWSGLGIECSNLLDHSRWLPDCLLGNSPATLKSMLWAILGAVRLANENSQS